MKELFQIMEKYFSPDACSYNILIHGCVVSRRLEDAWKLFEEMRKRRLQPTLVTFGTLLYGLCLELRVDEALKLKEDMMRVYNVKPDGQVFASLIKGLCAVGELSLALGVKEEMDGKCSEAKDLFEDMPRQGCNPDVVSYRILFDGLCDGTQFREAALILNEMIFKGFVPRSARINLFIGQLCEIGNVEDL
ncbi:putative pentatricopeptide repeat-containing protein [Citrus sinensis]|nr:putative pentatricopeptide repeat-containing protein [Citrus sinensis]